LTAKVFLNANWGLAFAADGQNFDIEFSCLSDGEKCFFAAALAIAANQCYGPLLCFWDEPDNYVSLAEVQHLIDRLRRGFDNRGQLILTSHDTQTIMGFPLEQCALLTRKSRLEPARIKKLDESQVGDSLINALLIGSLDES
jgi:ATPase subunit of ABC transporter with duplicated ATPase domains